MKKKIILIFLLIFLISLTTTAETVKIALISDIGGFGDYSYNDQLRSSLNKLENENITIVYKESKQMTDYVDNINYYAKSDFDLIWSIGFTMEQAVKENAQMYPEQNFIIFDAVVKEDNVSSLTFNKEEAGFLAGLTAALASKNARVGFIGGKNNKEIQKYQLGFNSAVKAVNPEIEIFSKYLGSFNDYSQAKKISSQFAEKKVDIIFYAAGAASNGIIDSALEKNIKLISLNTADIKLAPKNILTVVIKNTDYIVKKIVNNFLNDNYKSEIKSYGLESNAVILEKKQLDNFLKEETITKIEEFKQQYLEGEINISANS